MTPQELLYSVLTNAFTGKLVEQNANEEVKDKTCVIVSEAPFDIPDNWKWNILSNLADLYTGNSINESEKKQKYEGLKEGYDYIGTKDVEFDHTIDYENGVRIPFETPFRVAKTNSILMCIEGGSAGRKIGILNKNVCFGNKLCCFECKTIDNKFLYFYLQSLQFKTQFTEGLSGIIGGVSINKLKKLLVPLPPLEEQKRIVAKIEELMPFVDKYEAAWDKLERFNKEFPLDMEKSILQMAIQGKLVEQRAEEGTGEELFESIQQEKQRLIKEGKIKKEKPLPEISKDEIPFDIPETWKWVRVDDIVEKEIKRGKSPKYSISGKKFAFAQKCNSKYNGICYDLALRISDDSLSRYSENEFLRNNDIVINSTGTGTLGRVGFIDNIKELMYAPDSHVTTIRVFKNISAKFIFYFLKFNSPQMEKLGEGSTNQKELKPYTIANFTLPLPPFSEQQRIVAKIEELLPLCRQLQK